jgi:hypothetical protein
LDVDRGLHAQQPTDDQQQRYPDTHAPPPEYNRTTVQFFRPEVSTTGRPSGSVDAQQPAQKTRQHPGRVLTCFLLDQSLGKSTGCGPSGR